MRTSCWPTRSAGESWPTAAIPADNPDCSCKLVDGPAAAGRTARRGHSSTKASGAADGRPGFGGRACLSGRRSRARTPRCWSRRSGVVLLPPPRDAGCGRHPLTGVLQRCRPAQGVRHGAGGSVQQVREGCGLGCGCVRGFRYDNTRRKRLPRPSSHTLIRICSCI